MDNMSTILVKFGKKWSENNIKSSYSNNFCQDLSGFHMQTQENHLWLLKIFFFGGFFVRLGGDRKGKKLYLFLGFDNFGDSNSYTSSTFSSILTSLSLNLKHSSCPSF